MDIEQESDRILTTYNKAYQLKCVCDHEHLARIVASCKFDETDIHDILDDSYRWVMKPYRKCDNTTRNITQEVCEEIEWLAE